MQIAIYSSSCVARQTEYVSQLVQCLNNKGVAALLYEPFFRSLSGEQQLQLRLPNVKLFAESKDLSPEEVRCLMSVGGAGTVLDAASLVFGTTIPMVGLSAGRLGFLPSISISIDDVCGALNDIFSGNFDVEYRSTLQVEGCLGKRRYALNEVCLQKRGAPIAEINVHINGEFLNNYWADGLIVATPTGSTAYSLSAGGPIVAPDAPCLIVSPIAPHSLNVRPIVVPDSACIELEMITRGGSVIVGVDSHSDEIPTGTKLKVQKSATKIGFIKFKHFSFYRTLREKLLWGADKRG
ncbi:MAG: NAD(+)/NADH kinase [Prevotellaceae bacterium]|jgi:NAD+ kinase|nr:NAD(+)/NADH kinase [Prevotellaceae bacterium]